MYEYRAKVVRIVDGDTLDLDIDVGFYLTARVRCRLLGIDTPERGQAGYREAAEALHVLCTLAAGAGGWLTVRTAKGDSFGRWLVDILSPAAVGGTVNQAMLDNGYAVAYRGR